MLPCIQFKMDKLVVAGRNGCRQNNMSQHVLRITGYDVRGMSINDCFTVLFYYTPLSFARLCVL